MAVTPEPPTAYRVMRHAEADTWIPVGGAQGPDAATQIMLGISRGWPGAYLVDGPHGDALEQPRCCAWLNTDATRLRPPGPDAEHADAVTSGIVAPAGPEHQRVPPAPKMIETMGGGKWRLDGGEYVPVIEDAAE